MRKTLCLIAIIYSVVGCRNSSTPLDQKIIDGINGPMVYVFDSDGKIKYSFKEKPEAPMVSIFLDRDTVVLGEEFSSLFIFENGSARAIVEKPSNVVVEKSMQRYRFVPSETGLYEFQGNFLSDSVEVPFQYKFIVIAGKHHR
jgi:hypothetical protein